MLVRTVVHHKVKNDFDISLLRFCHQAVEIGERAVLWINVAIV